MPAPPHGSFGSAGRIEPTRENVLPTPAERAAGLVLVGAQFLLIVHIALEGALIAQHWWGLAIQISALLFALRAAQEMGLRTLTPLPLPKAGAPLIRTGPFRRMRHPLYTALLIAVFAGVICPPRLVPIADWLGLVVVLYLKSILEERHLRNRFREYTGYAAVTPRFLPRLRW